MLTHVLLGTRAKELGGLAVTASPHQPIDVVGSRSQFRRYAGVVSARIMDLRSPRSAASRARQNWSLPGAGCCTPPALADVPSARTVFGVGICSLLISGPDGWRAVAVAEQQVSRRSGQEGEPVGGDPVGEGDQLATSSSSMTSVTPLAIQVALSTASCSAQVRTCPVSLTALPKVSDHDQPGLVCRQLPGRIQELVARQFPGPKRLGNGTDARAVHPLDNFGLAVLLVDHGRVVRADQLVLVECSTASTSVSAAETLSYCAVYRTRS